MRGQGVILGTAFAALLVGALFLQGIAQEGPSDPTPSTRNGAPAGWLALKLLLEQRGLEVRVREDLSAPLLQEGDGRALLVVPPPAASAWSEREVARALALVEEGRLSVLLSCDDDRAGSSRVQAWTRALGVRCTERELDGDERAEGTMPAYEGSLFVRGRGRVAPTDEAASVPAWALDEGDVLVLRQRRGLGELTVVGSPSVLANDGLGEADNARFLLSLVPAVGGVDAVGLVGPAGLVVIDESHHRIRGAEALDEALAGTGPRVALLALLLLVPAVLFGFAPRRGDPPPATEGARVGAAAAQARALAALYTRAGVEVGRTAVDPKARARARSER